MNSENPVAANAETTSGSRLRKRIKSATTGVSSLAIFVVIGYALYAGLVRQTNEVGPLGFDKAGRQIFLQTMSTIYTEPKGLVIDSDWDDSSLLERLLVKEPIRTTFRFVLPAESPAPDASASREWLDATTASFFAGFAPTPDAFISPTEDRTIPLSTFRQQLDRAGAKTMEDMLAGMGFRRVEVMHGARLVVDYDLVPLGSGNQTVRGY